MRPGAGHGGSGGGDKDDLASSRRWPPQPARAEYSKLEYSGLSATLRASLLAEACVPRSRTLDDPRYHRLIARLRKARLDAGLTEAEVERALDFPPGIVAKWEARQTLLYALEFSDLAALYGRPAKYFLSAGRRGRLP